MTDFADQLGPGYLNLVMRRLAQRLATEGDAHLRRSGSGVPARSTAILAYISRYSGTPIVDVAEALGYTHPAVAKSIEQLEQAGLVQSSTSKEDSRRRCVSLTRKGRLEVKRVEEVAERAAVAFQEIFDDIGVDLFTALRRFEVELSRRPLSGRLLEVDTPRPQVRKRA